MHRASRRLRLRFALQILLKAVAPALGADEVDCDLSREEEQERRELCRWLVPVPVAPQAKQGTLGEILSVMKKFRRTS